MVHPSTPVAIIVNDEADFKEFLKLSPHDYSDFATKGIDL
jgi:hypothetical protein